MPAIGRMSGALVMIAAIAPLAGQGPATPAFDVASVRASAPRTARSVRMLPTRIEFVSTPLRELMLFAFDLEVYRLSAPAWINEVRFDVAGTYPAGTTRQQAREMAQTLLRDRFGLVARFEPLQMDAYDLIVGKDGIKMKAVEPLDELNKDFTTSAGQKPAVDSVAETADGPVRSMVIPGEVGSRMVTAQSLYELRTTLQRTQLIDAVRISIPQFVSLLRLNVDRPVIDRTGLTGLYQFKVELDVSQMVLRTLRTDREGNPISSEPTGVSTFKAVEGLGLKLEERRSPIDVLVVDKIERTPTEN